MGTLIAWITESPEDCPLAFSNLLVIAFRVAVAVIGPPPRKCQTPTSYHPRAESAATAIWLVRNPRFRTHSNRMAAAGSASPSVRLYGVGVGLRSARPSRGVVDREIGLSVRGIGGGSEASRLSTQKDIRPVCRPDRESLSPARSRPTAMSPVELGNGTWGHLPQFLPTATDLTPTSGSVVEDMEPNPKIKEAFGQPQSRPEMVETGACGNDQIRDTTPTDLERADPALQEEARHSFTRTRKNEVLSLFRAHQSACDRFSSRRKSLQRHQSARSLRRRRRRVGWSVGEV